MSLYFYVIPLVLGPLAILLAAFLILPSEWFARKSHDPWLSGIGYGTTLRNADCQVLIYGDSAAEVGINPELVRKRTGLTTCNIAQIEGLIVLSGHFVLDEYLAHNPHPRVLIFLFAPEDFNPKRARSEHAVFEAITYQMGRSNQIPTLINLSSHPEDFFRWVYKGVHMTLRNLPIKPTSEEGQHVREHTLGQLPIADPKMGSVCSDSTGNLPPDRAWIDGLRTKYANAATRVLIDVMPLPACDAGYAKVREQFDGLVDYPVESLPSGVYYRGGRHVDAHGSAMLSNMLAEQILTLLQTGTVAEER